MIQTQEHNHFCCRLSPAETPGWSSHQTLECFHFHSFHLDQACEPNTPVVKQPPASGHSPARGSQLFTLASQFTKGWHFRSHFNVSMTTLPQHQTPPISQWLRRLNRSANALHHVSGEDGPGTRDPCSSPDFHLSSSPCPWGCLVQDFLFKIESPLSSEIQGCPSGATFQKWPPLSR